jgi:hypothetical protein
VETSYLTRTVLGYMIYLFVNVAFSNVYYSVKRNRKADIYETHTRKHVVNPFQTVVLAFTYGSNKGKTSSHNKI